jgi:threonine aldolase
MPSPLDFRSDTLTTPTPQMRAAMAAAEVGDDVFDEDPTVHRLQERIAELVGKEAALFVPSGTMSNQIGIRVHCLAGDEFLCEAGSHIFNYEQAAHVQLSGVAPRPVEGEYGVLSVEQLAGLVRPENDHCPRTRLVCLENTHNRGGGRIAPLDSLTEICDWAHGQGLATHLDGARLFNAVVASGVSADRWANPFDTVSICFSKGLGAPVGSALCGPRDLVRRAKRHRKVLGGGMRQAGVIAAGALFALDHHIDRLAEDHANARRLGEAIRQIDGLRLSPAEVHTNIVMFEVDPALGMAPEFVGRLKAKGLLMMSMGPTRIRAVTHLDVNAGHVAQACEILESAAREAASGAPLAEMGRSYG